MKIITIQPEPVVDNMWVDKHAKAGESPFILGERVPYPFRVAEDGSVLDQDFWRGDPEGIIGFQNDEDVKTIDLWWADAVRNPDSIVGKFPVMREKGAGFYTYVVAIESVSVAEVEA